MNRPSAHAENIAVMRFYRFDERACSLVDELHSAGRISEDNAIAI